MLFARASLAATFLAAPLLVSAHGYIQEMNIAGKTYPGWLPFDSPYNGAKSIVRKISGDGPVEDPNAAGVACGAGNTATGAGVQTAPAKAGDKVTFTMNRWPDDHKGPITVYMANCNGPCSNFDATKGKSWFKIKEETLANGVWPSDKLIKNGLSDSVNIPSGLKSGNYLLRFEILALHSAHAPQYYPYCAQLAVTGGGSSVPQSSDLTSFPGAYNRKQIAFTGDIWSNPKSWPVSGPKVATLAGGSGGGDDPAPAPQPTPSTTTVKAPSTTTKVPVNAGESPKPTTSAVSSPSPSGGACKRMRRRKLRAATVERRYAQSAQVESRSLYDQSAKRAHAKHALKAAQAS